MRRLLAVFALSSLLAIASLPVPSATAQTKAAVDLRLVSQSAWNGPSRPLLITFEATNLSTTPLDDLSVILTIQAPARSRSAYALSLRSDATTPIFTFPFPQQGSLLPERARTFTLRQTLDVPTARGESVLYPLKVELLSRDVPAGTIRTPMIFLVERPQVPLNLQWTWIFGAPLEYRPDGVFLPGPLESDVSAGGRLEAMASALAGLKPLPVDVVMSSVLADQLGRLKEGYRIVSREGGLHSVPKGTGGALAAEKLLASLSTVAQRPDTELLAYPFGDASLPAMLRSGITDDLSVLFERGRNLVRSTLGSDPRTDVARPAQSQLDVLATNRLRALGARTVLLDADYLSPPATPPKFTAGPMVQLAGARRPMSAIVPDPQVMGRATAYPQDPTLAAHAALGELATIWLEFPGTPRRGAAVLFGEGTNLDPRFFPAFAALAGSSPWLHPVTARDLATITVDREQRPIPTRIYPGFNPAYVSQLLATRGALAQFEQTAEGAKPLVDRLRTQLLLADSGSFVSDPLRGRLFIDSAYGTIQRTYKRIVVSPGLVTLTSRQGSIFVTLENLTGYTVRVRILLIADRRISFVQGDSRRITLPPTQRTLRFSVRAETTGRFPIKVRVQTPADPRVAQTITETEVLVRSTAYNRVALLLTIGAALFLLGWWGRRFLPRRRS